MQPSLPLLVTVLSQLCKGTKLGEPEPVPGLLTQNRSPAASASDLVLGTAFRLFVVPRAWGSFGITSEEAFYFSFYKALKSLVKLMVAFLVSTRCPTPPLLLCPPERSGHRGWDSADLAGLSPPDCRQSLAKLQPHSLPGWVSG